MVSALIVPLPRRQSHPNSMFESFTFKITILQYMDQQLATIDKENNPHSQNRPLRRFLYKPPPITTRPVALDGEASIRPQTLSNSRLLPPQTTLPIQPRVIATHHKLRDFFTINSGQQAEGRQFLRRRSIDASGVSIQPLGKEKMPQMRRKLTYRRLYLQQKERYEAILRRYGVEERVDDTEFQRFMAGEGIFEL